MPKISLRGEKMPASPIRKLVPFAENAKKRGIHVFHLNIGQPDIPTPPEFFQAIHNANLRVLEYSHSAGIESYRKSLVSYYQNIGISLSIDNILVTTGGSEALRFAFLSCLNPDDEVIIPEPLYANYIGFSNESGIKVVALTTRIENDFDLPGADEFEKLITPKTKAILICNPGNPTGKLYSLETLERLAKLAKDHDLFLIADEVYREFAYDGAVHHSVLSLPGLEEHAVVVDSISKRFSACGARIGTFVTRNRSLIATALKYAQARLSPPSLGQIGAEALATLPKSFFDRIVAEYVSRRNTLVEGLRKIEGTLVPEVSGAFYTVVRLPVDDSEKFCQWMLEKFEFKNSTVMMAPAAGFYSTPGLGRDEVRIAYVLNVDELKKALICLEQGLLAYPGRKIATPLANSVKA